MAENNFYDPDEIARKNMVDSFAASFCSGGDCDDFGKQASLDAGEGYQDVSNTGVDSVSEEEIAMLRKLAAACDEEADDDEQGTNQNQLGIVIENIASDQLDDEMQKIAYDFMDDKLQALGISAFDYVNAQIGNEVLASHISEEAEKLAVAADMSVYQVADDMLVALSEKLS